VIEPTVQPETAKKGQGIHPAFARTCGMVAAVGLALVGVGALVSLKHFFFAYLTAYTTCLTLVLGMMFFVLLHYVVDAGWSTVVRRPAEQFLAALLPLAGLLLPVLLGISWLYSWSGADDELARAKAPYLNVPFFLVRAGVYFAAWLVIQHIFRGGSLAQDERGDPNITLRLRKWSALGLIVYALTLSFASIDWLMTLDYHWYSTMFGTYVWSGAAVSGLALLSIVVIWLGQGPLRGKVPVDRRHDLGKWVFAFAVFWAYIAFSQYFLIWYGNIPEETVWMIGRWTGQDGTSRWWTVSILVPICLFIIPFVALMSANTKRRPEVLVGVCAVVLVGHYLDCYWLVMPAAYESGPKLSLIWIDLGALALIGGICGWSWARAMTRNAYYPIRDPRLAEALADHRPHGVDSIRDPVAGRRPGQPRTQETPHGGQVETG
jgi:hypothetical protein